MLIDSFFKEHIFAESVEIYFKVIKHQKLKGHILFNYVAHSS